MPSSYRNRVEEKDLSGFSSQNNNQITAIVVKSKKGTKVPKLCFNEADVILRFGKPDSEHFSVFEVINAVQVTPVYVSSALGSNYKYAGVDVTTTSVIPFGKKCGRVYETFNNNSYNNVQRNQNYVVIDSADGKTKTFSGTVVGSFPMIPETVEILLNGEKLNVTINPTTGEITGDIVTNSVIDFTDGSYSIEFSGDVGSVATYVTTIPVPSTGFDLSSGGQDKKVNIEVDGTLFKNVNLGSSSTTTASDIISAINTELGYTCASLQTVGTNNYIKLSGRIASANFGRIRILPPSNGLSALNIVFDTSATEIDSKNSVSPTGYVPKYKDKIEINYNYSTNIKSDTSFSLFTASPFNDNVETYTVEVYRVTGKIYKCILRQLTPYGSIQVKMYEFSLLREKNSFGKSIYYEDVFKDDDYLKIYVNTDYSNVADPVREEVTLSGGYRGNEPTIVDYYDSWNYFKQKNIYKVKNFFDVVGNSATKILEIISNYQPYAFGATVVPFGNNSLDAINYRKNLGIDSDKIALYTNWELIEDSYNNSYVWTSGMGKVAVKYAQMNDVFDGLAPAGIDDASGHGGQLKTGFRVIRREYDYTDHELQMLDENQINPIIKNDFYGNMIYGDRTLQVSNSDTSYIPHRRLFNYIIENVSVQILDKQIFKLNDQINRLLVKSQTETFLAPILALNLIRDLYVQCDETNNNDDVLQLRQFVLDIFIKVTPFSEFVKLRLTRLPQGGSISQFIQ